MKTTDFNFQISSKSLNESMFKKFGVKVDLENYTREELENYRNIIRTKLSQSEGNAGFNDLLANEDYQKDKHMLDLLNSRIKEMLGESILNEKSKSEKQARTMAAAAHNPKFAKKVGIKTSVAKEFNKKDKGTKLLSKAMKHKKKKKKTNESNKPGLPGNPRPATMDFGNKPVLTDPDKPLDPKSWEYRTRHRPTTSSAAGRESNEIQQDVDNRNERLTQNREVRKKSPTSSGTLKNYLNNRPPRSEGIELSNGKYSKSTMESKTMKKPKKKAAKPDYLDFDGDGNKKEPMKKALKDRKKAPPFKKKKVKESFLNRKHNYAIIIESLKYLISENEEDKAKDISGSADMVSDITNFMQRLGTMQTKTMIDLSDSIRKNFGQAESDAFRNSIDPALKQALEVLTKVRESISSAVAQLAGGELPQETMGAEPVNPAPSDSMNTSMTAGMSDEFGASDAASGGFDTAGREKRESIERSKARRLSEAHSLMTKLSK